jgi:hypothetical protein
MKARPYLKNTQHSGSSGEHLPSKHQALSSNSSTAKKNSDSHNFLCQHYNLPAKEVNHTLAQSKMCLQFEKNKHGESV